MCYAILGRAEVEASIVVITSTVLVFHHSTLVLFNLGATYLYVSTYFGMNIDGVCVPLDMPIS